jgi:hypothetical protein
MIPDAPVENPDLPRRPPGEDLIAELEVILAQEAAEEVGPIEVDPGREAPARSTERIWGPGAAGGG